jgi:predicted regulator of Ras-like GTPase activity (Roadblock/LC7/MglB family)
MLLDKKLSTLLESLFASYAENQSLEVISLSTTDGFPVCNFSRVAGDFEAGSMAAASSTLYSVSDAVARQILSKSFKVTFIEAEQGNVAFVALELKDKDLVLAMSAKQSMNIASLRMLINRLAKEIGELEVA